MEMEMDANASDVLSTLLLDAQQTVTPKLLASRLSLPLPACRALLAAFADAHRELAATFVLTGPADGQLKVTLVPADKLAEAKKAFEQCTAHIHSLSPAPLRDPESLFLVDAPLLRNPDFDHAGLWPVRNIKCVKSTVKRAPPSSVSAPPRPVAKPVEKKEEKKEEPKEKEKKGIAGFFGKQTAKESKQEAPNPSASAAPSKSSSSSAPPKQIATSKSKSKKTVLPAKKAESDDDDAVIGRRKRRAVASDDSEEDEDDGMAKKKALLAAERAKKESDDEEQPKPQPAEKPKPIKHVSKPAVSQSKPQDEGPVEMQRVKKRRRVVKKVTTTDADGYLVTQDVSEFEEYSEDEPVRKSTSHSHPAPAKKEKDDSDGSPEKGKKKKGKDSKGQMSIASFFGKK